MSLSPIRQSLEKLATSAVPDYRTLASVVAEYFETRDPTLVAKIPVGGSYDAGEPAAVAVRSPHDPDAQAIFELVALLIAQNRYTDAFVDPQYQGGFGNSAFSYNRPNEHRAAHLALIDAARRVGVSDWDLARYVMLEHGTHFDFGWTDEKSKQPIGWTTDPRAFDRVSPTTFTPGSPFEELVWGLSNSDLSRLMLETTPGRWGNADARPPFALLGTLAAFRPDALEPWMERAVTGAGFHPWDWQHILRVNDRFDSRCTALAAKLAGADRLSLLMIFTSLRDQRFLSDARALALECDPAEHSMAWLLLADYFPADLATYAENAIRARALDDSFSVYVLEKVFQTLASIWNGQGRAVFETILECPYLPLARSYGDKVSLYSYGIQSLLAADPEIPAAEIRDWATRAVAAINSAEIDKKEASAVLLIFWTAATDETPSPLCDLLMNLLGDKLKSLRQLAVKGLAKLADSELIAWASGLVTTGKLDQKLGAAELLAKIGDPASAAVLAGALESEQNDKARAGFREAIASLEAKGGVPAASEAVPPAVSLAELEAACAKQAAKLKFPATSWFKPESLPPLVTTDGTHLSQPALIFLVTKQSKHKTIDAAPDIQPLLAHLDRARCAPFALALVEGFLNSEQAAGDRWALALGGLLGDNRLIPPLLSRIPDWCDNARHKLAEYAAQTIALLPGNEPLMVLDTLANRYRNKYKNVGKACAAAFQAAATARGITPAELGDLVVPTFEFDEDGLRTFAWEGGSVGAELGPDFKLSWFDPVSDKTWSSLPAAAPAAVKEEVKLLGKLLREAVKAQTARLELALVFQRRWPVARWRELYEAHPLLRGFASGLVWGVYDAAGLLLRTFRRYHNGILADAAGTEEELLETDAQIGMVHPLEFDEAVRQAWQAHLRRLKVKQPFPQLDRPVELMDPLLANRREIAITRDKKLSAGTFRSRAEKRGWFRGSVVDAGGISSFVKAYPLAGVEVILPTENFWVGFDPMQEIDLSAAYFVKSETVQRGSYTYDEPGPDDPRVLKFGEVPAVVYSETISDLKAIVATKE
jgi:hypothetical protein